MRKPPSGLLPALLLVAGLSLPGLILTDATAGEPGVIQNEGPLQLEKSEHDFGVVEQNKEYPAEIRYRNTGKVAIRNLRVKADCSCYAASLSATDLAPEAVGTLRIRFRTLTFNGPVHKKLRLLYDDGATRHAAISLTMKVFGGVVVNPGRLHFGDVLTGSRPKGEVKVMWHAEAGQAFEILDIDVEGQPIETRVVPHSVPEFPKWKGWLVHFQFSKPPPDGVYSKRAVLKTTHPSNPRVIIPLTAHVVGKVWVQTHRVHLGLIPSGKTRTASISFRPFDPSIKLGRVSARSRKGVLKVAIEDGFGPRGPIKKLKVTVPANAPAGSLDDIIELHTQVPGEEITEIGVRGRIFVPRTGR
jgi:hypothetical protein